MSISQNELKELLNSQDGLDDEVLKKADEIREYISKVYEYYNDDEESENNLLNILTNDDYLLEQLMDKISLLTLLEMTDKKDIPKESIENTYLTVIDSFFELSKAIDPLNGFGKERLQAGLSLIRNFEELYWPVVTRITAENAEAFRELISKEYFEDVVAGRKNAIGALRHVDEDVVAAGVIVYTVFEPPATESSIIHIDFIYVHPEVRQQGIGNFLMASVLELALIDEQTIVRVELNARQIEDDDEDDDREVLENFLDSWKFGFTLSTGTHFAQQITDSNGNHTVYKPEKEIRPLHRLGKRGPELLKELFAATDNFTNGLELFPFSFFDPDVSCVILENGVIRTALLMHRFDNGDYRYEGVISIDEVRSNDFMNLFRFAYNNCLLMGDSGRYIYGDISSEEEYNFFSNLGTDTRVIISFIGILDRSEAEITGQMWEELRKEAGFSNDKIPDDDVDIDDSKVDFLSDFLTGKKSS